MTKREKLNAIRNYALKSIFDKLDMADDKEINWYDVDEGNSPVVRKDPCDDDNTYTLDSLDKNGISASNSCDSVDIPWSDVDTDTIVTIAEELDELYDSSSEDLDVDDVDGKLMKELCLRDDIMKVAENIINELDIPAADPDILFKEMATACYDYLKWCDSPADETEGGDDD